MQNVAFFIESKIIVFSILQNIRVCMTNFQYNLECSFSSSNKKMKYQIFENVVFTKKISRPTRNDK